MTDVKLVRAWAVEQGLVKAGSRGRLSKSVLEAYEAYQLMQDEALKMLTDSQSVSVVSGTSVGDKPKTEYDTYGF